MAKKTNLPQWVTDAFREMRKLKVEDTIRVWYPDNLNTFHVRGRVDDWLIVRYRSKGVRTWSYLCLSPAWWSVFSRGLTFKVQRKA